PTAKKVTGLSKPVPVAFSVRGSRFSRCGRKEGGVYRRKEDLCLAKNMMALPYLKGDTQGHLQLTLHAGREGYSKACLAKLIEPPCWHGVCFTACQHGGSIRTTRMVMLWLGPWRWFRGRPQGP